MKKFIFTIALLLIVATQSFAQNFQVFIGKDNDIRLIGEQQRFTEKVFDYAYVEAAEYGCYVQLIHEQTFWKSLALHAEFRTTFAETIGILGPGWTFGFNTGTIGVQALCRYDNVGFNAQMSGVYSFDWGFVNLYGYADVWGQKDVSLFSETRLYFPVVKEHFELGGILDIAEFGGEFSYTPYLGLKYLF